MTQMNTDLSQTVAFNTVIDRVRTQLSTAVAYPDPLQKSVILGFQVCGH